MTKRPVRHVAFEPTFEVRTLCSAAFFAANWGGETIGASREGGNSGALKGEVRDNRFPASYSSAGSVQAECEPRSGSHADWPVRPVRPCAYGRIRPGASKRIVSRSSVSCRSASDAPTCLTSSTVRYASRTGAVQRFRFRIGTDRRRGRRQRPWSPDDWLLPAAAITEAMVVRPH